MSHQRGMTRGMSGNLSMIGSLTVLFLGGTTHSSETNLTFWVQSEETPNHHQQGELGT